MDHFRVIDRYAQQDFMMYEPKVVGVDFDETISDNPEAWLRVMQILELCGYTVVVVTWRKPEMSEELQFLVDKGYKIYYTSLRAKKEFMLKLGIDVAIWIDDNPAAIVSDAPDIHFTRH